METEIELIEDLAKELCLKQITLIRIYKYLAFFKNMQCKNNIGLNAFLTSFFKFTNCIYFGICV